MCGLVIIGKVGLLYVHRQAEVVAPEPVVFVVVCIKLKHVAKVFILVDTVVAESYMLGEHVISFVFTVYVKVYRYYVVCVRNLCKLSYFHGYGICHECSALCICKQNPTFALCEPERLHLLGELQAIRFFGIVPSDVATAFNLYRVDEILIYTVACNHEFCSKVCLFGNVACRVNHVDVYSGNRTTVCEPLRDNGVYTSERYADILVNSILQFVLLVCARHNLVHLELGKHHVVVVVLACGLFEFEVSVAASQVQRRRCVFGTCLHRQVVVVAGECAVQLPVVAVFAYVQVQLFGVVVAGCTCLIVEAHVLYGLVKRDGDVWHYRSIVAAAVCCVEYC